MQGNGANGDNIDKDVLPQVRPGTPGEISEAPHEAATSRDGRTLLLSVVVFCFFHLFN
jgi:hypothetical protein